MSERPSITVAIVHYRSAGMVLDLVRDLQAQEGVDLDIHVVECGDDGSVAELRRAFPRVTLHDPRRNAGYAAGNNVVFAHSSSSTDVLVINPDVRIPSSGMVRRLVATLEAAPEAAAAAPVIRTEAGMIEYLGSRIDFRRAVAEHTDTHVPDWPSDDPTLDLEWLDGACLLFRRQALEEVGGFDERFFLFVEEVDWCLRARARGWRLRLVRDCEVTHQRSSSFGKSTKGTYYSFRNTYLLCLKHAAHFLFWRLHWGLRLARFLRREEHRRSGHAGAAMQGAWHALTGRWGPAPEDRSNRSSDRATEDGR